MYIVNAENPVNATARRIITISRNFTGGFPFMLKLSGVIYQRITSIDKLKIRIPRLADAFVFKYK